MTSIPAIIRLLLTAGTLATFLGPTFADAVHREAAPPLAETELADAKPSPAERPGSADQDRPRPSRRQRREPAPRGSASVTPASVTQDHADDEHGGGGAPTRSSGTTSTAINDTANGAHAPSAGNGLLSEFDLDESSPLPPELRERLGLDAGRAPDTRSPGAADDLADAGGAPGGPNGQAGTGGPDGLKGGAGCSIQCITSGRAYGRGTGAELVVTTDTPAHIVLIVHELGSGDPHYAQNVGRTMSFRHLFDELEQGTTYEVYASATDVYGEESSATGTFTTNRRHARVTFGGTTVTSHPYDGDFFFDHRIDDDWIEHLSVGHWPHPHNHPLGGTTDVELAGVGSTLEPAFHVTQSPGPGEADDVCQAVPGPGNGPPSYTNLCQTTVAASEVFELDADGPAGYPQARSFSATLTGSNSRGLAIESYVEVEVWYAQ